MGDLWGHLESLATVATEVGRMCDAVAASLDRKRAASVGIERSYAEVLELLAEAVDETGRRGRAVEKADERVDTLLRFYYANRRHTVNTVAAGALRLAAQRAFDALRDPEDGDGMAGSALSSHRGTDIGPLVMGGFVHDLFHRRQDAIGLQQQQSGVRLVTERVADIAGP